MFGLNIVEVISKLEDSVVRTSSNGDVFSVLYKSALGKTVHVDFIRATANTYETKLQYFSYNDFSGVIGMFSKKLYFKYGSEGFFKRYRDARGNWHDMFITYDLMDGLEILGINSKKFDSIKTLDDIVAMIAESPLFGSEMVKHESLNQADKKSCKRPNIDWMVEELRNLDFKRKIEDDDFFFKRHPRYEEVMAEIADLSTRVVPKSRFGGGFLIQNCGFEPGLRLGAVLRALHERFGDTIDSQTENDVIDFVNEWKEFPL